MTDKFWCPVHQRHLTWYEFRAETCFWCEPDAIPWDEAAKHDTPGWEARKKVWGSIRDLTPEQRQALVPSPAPGPGVVTPSMAMLERWARAQKRA